MINVKKVIEEFYVKNVTLNQGILKIIMENVMNVVVNLWL